MLVAWLNANVQTMLKAAPIKHPTKGNAGIRAALNASSNGIAAVLQVIGTNHTLISNLSTQDVRSNVHAGVYGENCNTHLDSVSPAFVWHSQLWQTSVVRSMASITELGGKDTISFVPHLPPHVWGVGEGLISGTKLAGGLAPL